VSIRLRCVRNEIIVEQVANRPIIYLDNWAYNLFTENEELGGKFIKLMNEKEGSIAFSIMNLYEITIREDKDQVEKIKNYIDEFDVVLIDISPTKVIMKEKLHKNGKFIGCPAVDYKLLEAYVLYAHDYLKPFKTSELVTKLQEEMKTQNGFFKQKFEEELFPFIKKARTQGDLISQAKMRFEKKLQSEFPYTEGIYSKCIDFIIVNEKMQMPDKEWRDIFHLIVPIAYCDYVLIDSRWRSFVDSIDIQHPYIAKVYSRNYIKNFLNDLKDYVTHPEEWKIGSCKALEYDIPGNSRPN